ncbi:hypothetical protein WAI453_000665 [Rhynchosporium graminicola]
MNCCQGGPNYSLAKRDLARATKVKGQWIMKDAARFLSWDRICEEAGRLQELHSIYQGDISTEEPLPTAYRKALPGLNALLLEEARWRCAFLERTLPTRPGFRKHYKLVWNQRKGYVKCKTAQADAFEHCAKTFSTDRLEFCLRVLVQDPWMNPGFWDPEADCSERLGRRFDPSVICAMLNQHLEESYKQGLKEEISRLDQILYDSYTDLYAIFHTMSMLRLHQPTFKPKHVRSILPQRLGDMLKRNCIVTPK